MLNVKKSLLIATVGVLSLAGCGETQPQVPSLYAQPKVVREDTNTGKFYYIPSYVFGSTVTKDWVQKNKIETSGLMDCPAGNALVTNRKEKQNYDKYNQNFRDILTPKELYDYDNNPNITPRMDSKEYKEMVSYLTGVYRKHEMMCVPPMPQKQVTQYKAYLAQQAKINNDPRVVAARVQANAQLQQAVMEKNSRDEAAFQQSLQNLNNQVANMTPKTYNVNVMHY